LQEVETTSNESNSYQRLSGGTEHEAFHTWPGFRRHCGKRCHGKRGEAPGRYRTGHRLCAAHAVLPALRPYALDSDTTYVLTGLYYVEPNHSITIQPGTVILGHKVTGGTLIVTKGAQIFRARRCAAAHRVHQQPDPRKPQPGDWGGIIILGDAPTNKVNPVIEGGLIGGSCGGGVTTYGGSNANDNSGVLSYIRIEFAGFRFQLNNEVNGLTMGGVGAGTQIDHIQVSYSNDDAYEWFGGTVNCNYLATMGTTDDEFDTDFGFTGHVQFGFGLRDPDFWDPTGQSNGFESDNDGSSTSTDNPHTHPIFSNIT
jgi:hypothetical protein